MMCRAPLLALKVSQVAKTHQLPVLFIPKTEVEGLKAGQECDRFNVLEQWMRLMTSLKIVIRDSGTQVMNVMEPDIAREPLQ